MTLLIKKISYIEQRNDISRVKKVELLISLIKPYIYEVNYKVYYNHTNFNEYHYSSSVIKRGNTSVNDSKLHRYVMEQLEDEYVINKICKNINDISIEDYRKVFIDRFILKRKPQASILSMNISISTYYKYLNYSIMDFLGNRDG